MVNKAKFRSIKIKVTFRSGKVTLYRHSASHFLDGVFKKISVSTCVISLYGQITALIEHWHRPLFCCLVIHKLCGRVIFACEFIHILMVVRQKTHKICRVSGTCPSDPVPLTLLKQKTTEIKISSYRLLAYSC